MKILILASWYKSAENPNEGSFIEEQARMLIEAGHDVSVVHCYLNGTFSETLKGSKSSIYSYDDNGLRTIKICVNIIFPKIRRLNYLRLFKKVLRFQSTRNDLFQPDIIHSHSTFMGGFVAYKLSKKLQIPYFHTEHTSGFLFNKKQYTRYDLNLCKTVFSNSVKSFFVSNYFLVKMKEVLNDPISKGEVLNNVVNPIFFTESNENKFNDFTFIMVASFNPIKNHRVLIEAWKILSETKKCKLLLVGKGRLLSETQQLVKEYNLTESVQFCGELDRLNTCNIMSKSHVLISSSIIETFGMTVAEANALGLPVIVNNSGGVLDIVTDETGILIDCMNTETLVDAMDEIYRNYSSYNPKRISQITEEKFSEEVICKQLEEYYSQFLNSKSLQT